MSNEIVIVEPVAVKPATAAKMLDCGTTKIWELRRSGALETVFIGSDPRITVASIKRLAKVAG